MVFGLPLYNLDECIKYIMIKLTDKGFAVHLAIPNKLLISWEPESEKQSLYCKKLYMLDNNTNNKKTYLALENGPSKNNYDNNMKLFSNKPTKNTKNYKPIDDYKNSLSSGEYNTDDISLFRSKIDELFTS